MDTYQYFAMIAMALFITQTNNGSTSANEVSLFPIYHAHPSRTDTLTSIMYSNNAS